MWVRVHGLPEDITVFLEPWRVVNLDHEGLNTAVVRIITVKKLAGLKQ